MASDDLPVAAQRVLRDYLGSALELELVLLLRASPERRWRPADATAELRTGDEATANALRNLAELGLFAEDAQGFVYAPRNAGLESDVDALAEASATRRTKVIEFLYQRPSDRVTLFADAFLFRRRG